MSAGRFTLVLVQALESGDERESPIWFDIKASKAQSYAEEGYKIRELYERADVPRETLAEALMSVLIKYTNLSTDAIDECVPVMLAVIPAAEAPVVACPCGGWSGAGSEFHHTGCAELVTGIVAAMIKAGGYARAHHGEAVPVFDVSRETPPRVAIVAGVSQSTLSNVPRETVMPDSIRTLDLNLDPNQVQTVAERVRNGVRALFEQGGKDGE